MHRLEVLLFMLALESGPGGPTVDWFAELEAMGEGDVQALARLRRLVTSQLIRMGAYSVQSSWDDFAQEVLIKVWRAHRDGKIRERKGVGAFIRTTTRNAFIDWKRSHHREVDLGEDAVQAQADDPGEELALDPGTQLVLRRAIEGLSDRHREVIESLYLQGNSYDETARHLDRPRGTINRLQREAMAELRKTMLGSNPDGTAGGIGS